MKHFPHARKSAIAAALVLAFAGAALADETCNSPYTTRLIKGQEDYVHVWTLGVGGRRRRLGQAGDDRRPPEVEELRQGGAHALGRRTRRSAPHGLHRRPPHLWAGGLDNTKIYVFDVGSNPAKPKLVRTIADLPAKTGFVGPHTFYAMPGRMLIQALSNNKDHGGATGMAVYNNKGDVCRQVRHADGRAGRRKGDGYGYDLAINPRKNVLLTSSFTGWNNYMMDMGKMVKDGEAMKRFGNTMVAWDLKAMKPKKIFSVPGAPLEIRWSLNPKDNWAVTATALTSKIWLIKQDGKGDWQAKDVATIGDPSKIPLPVDISIAADGKGLWVNTFMDGKTRYFDLSNPEAPKQTYRRKPASRSTWSRRAGTASASTSPRRCSPTGTRRARTTSSSCALYHWNGKELQEQCRGRLQQGEAGPRAPHEVQRQGWQEDLARSSPRSPRCCWRGRRSRTAPSTGRSRRGR